MSTDMPCVGTYYKPKMCPTGPLGNKGLFRPEVGMLKNNIATLRKARNNMSQTTLAEAIGTTLNQLGKIERGARPLTSEWIEKIADALQVEPFRIIAPERLFPSEAQLADMLQHAQQQIPTGLPYSEWPRSVAAGLHTRLLLLADDRANAEEKAERSAPLRVEA